MVSLPDFALLDPVTMNAGLFRSLPRGAKPVLDAIKEHSGLAYHYTGYRVDEIGLRVLLTLCGLIGMHQTPVKPAESGPNLLNLRDRLDLKGTAAIGKTLVWMGGVMDLVEACGAPRGTSNKATVLQRLEQLSHIQIAVRKVGSPEQLAKQRMLSYSINPNGKEIAILLCPHLCSPFSTKQFSKIDLTMLRAIKSPAGQILHAVLSDRIRSSQAFPVPYRLSTLAEVAFGPSMTLTVARKRVQLIRPAVHELDRAGWAIFEDLTGNRAISIIRLENVDPNKWVEIEARRAKVA